MSTSRPPRKSDRAIPGEPPYGQWEPPPTRRGVGCLVGGGVGAALLLILFVLYEVDARSDEGGLSAFWFWLWLAIPVGGYLFAAVATVRRSTRGFGQGMLLGLTVPILALFAAVLLISLLTPT